jgi:hypothetical protein
LFSLQKKYFPTTKPFTQLPLKIFIKTFGGNKNSITFASAFEKSTLFFDKKWGFYRGHGL